MAIAQSVCRLTLELVFCRRGTKVSSIAHDGFYDDNSSSSCEEYLYSRSDFESDSSDSDCDRSMNHSKRIVFVNGRKVKPKRNPSLAKKVVEKGRDLKSDIDCEFRPPTRIRFADDSSCSRAVAKSGNVNDDKSRSKTILRISCKEGKTRNSLGPDKIIKTSDNMASVADKKESFVATDEQNPVAVIKIQSIHRSNAEKSRSQIVTSDHVDDEEFGKLKRADSGFLQESSSSVSQDTVDSCDKDDSSRIEAGGKFEKEDGKMFWPVIGPKDGSRIERKSEMKIDFLKSQPDSGFEDPERVSPEGISSKESTLKRGTVKQSGSSSNDYSMMLRQASLRVFGLVGRRVKSYNEPGSRANVNAFIQGDYGLPTMEKQDSAEVKFLRPPEESHVTSVNEIDKEKNVGVLEQNHESVDEEEEWPEPPTFDDVSSEAEWQFMEGKVSSQEANVSHLLSNANMSHNIEEVRAKENSSYAQNLDFRQNNQYVSTGNKWQEVDSGDKGDFIECEEGEVFEPETPAISYHEEVFVPIQRCNNPYVIMNHEQQRFRRSGTEIIHEDHLGGRYERRFDDDCTICEWLESEKRASRRSADMEHFRKTTLNDCESVMKKMRHAQQIARKISGDESPRRASMRKSRGDGSASSAEDAVNQQNRKQEKNRFAEYGGRIPTNVNSRPVDHVDDLQGNTTVKKIPVIESHLGKREKEQTASVAAAQAGSNVAAMPTYEGQFDAKEFFIQQFNREKNHRKVKRNLSEDFLIVNAMPYSPPRVYQTPRYHVEPVHGIVPRNHSVPSLDRGRQNDVPIVRPRPSTQAIYNHSHYVRSEPQSHSSLRNRAADQPHSTTLSNGNSFDNSYQAPDQWLEEKIRNAPSRPPATKSGSLSPPLSPRGSDQKAPSVPSPQYTYYSQQDFGKKSFTDPFRAEREKSWFKKAARRLRRSLSFEDSNSRGTEKQEIFAEHQPLRPCNSSGNLKAEYTSYSKIESRDRFYSDGGSRQSGKRSVGLPTRGKEYKNDPNFHPKYGFMPKQEDRVQRPNGEVSSKASSYNDANGSSPHVLDNSNFIVQHNMYFGNNPPSQNSRILGHSGGGLFNGREVMVQPKQVRKSSQKTAKTKSFHSKK